LEKGIRGLNGKRLCSEFVGVNEKGLGNLINLENDMGPKFGGGPVLVVATTLGGEPTQDPLALLIAKEITLYLRGPHLGGAHPKAGGCVDTTTNG